MFHGDSSSSAPPGWRRSAAWRPRAVRVVLPRPAAPARRRRRRDAQAGRELPARGHRRRLQGHHGRPEHHHQARPGPAGDRLRDAAALQRELPAHQQRPGRERDPGQPEAVHDQAAPGHRVPERQDDDGRRRHLLVPAHRDPGERPHRVRRHGHDGHQEHEEAGQVHGAAPAEDPGLDGPADPGQLYVHDRAGRVQGVPGPADRHRRLQAQVVHARPAERPRAQPELLAQRPAVLRHGDDHRLQRLDRAGERAARRPDRRDDRPAAPRR